LRITADAVKLAHSNGVVGASRLGMLGRHEEDVVGLMPKSMRRTWRIFDRSDSGGRFLQADQHRQPGVAIGTVTAPTFKHKPSWPSIASNRYEDLSGPAAGDAWQLSCRRLLDLVNKYGGAMPNAKGVPEDQNFPWREELRRCAKVNIDTDLRRR